jgi:hypothetical protein
MQEHGPLPRRPFWCDTSLLSANRPAKAKPPEIDGSIEKEGRGPMPERTLPTVPLSGAECSING